MPNPAKLAYKLADAIAPWQLHWAVPATVVADFDDVTLVSGLFGFSVDEDTNDSYLHAYERTRLGRATLKTVPRPDVTGFRHLILRFGDIGDVASIELVGTDDTPVWAVATDQNEPQQADFLFDKLIEYRFPDLR